MNTFNSTISFVASSNLKETVKNSILETLKEGLNADRAIKHNPYGCPVFACAADLDRIADEFITIKLSASKACYRIDDAISCFSSKEAGVTMELINTLRELRAVRQELATLVGNHRDDLLMALQELVRTFKDSVADYGFEDIYRLTTVAYLGNSRNLEKLLCSKSSKTIKNYFKEVESAIAHTIDFSFTASEGCLVESYLHNCWKPFVKEYNKIIEDFNNSPL